MGLPVLLVVPFVCPPAPISRQVPWNLLARTLPPSATVRRGSAERPLRYTFGGLRSVYSNYRLQADQVANATLYTRGIRSFLASTPAPFATGWNEHVPGRGLHPLWAKAFSRRTTRQYQVYSCKILFGSPELSLFYPVPLLRQSANTGSTNVSKNPFTPPLTGAVMGEDQHIKQSSFPVPTSARCVSAFGPKAGSVTRQPWVWLSYAPPPLSRMAWRPCQELAFLL